MSKMAVHYDVPVLPEEIMVNILKRLLVKSLIRFQCVGKGWKNLFKSSSFVADHLHHSSAQNPSLIFRPNSNRQSRHLSLIDCEINVLEVQIPPLIGSSPYVRIVSSSNGLLCFATDKSLDSLFVWNPAIREIRQIPSIITSKSPLSHCTVGFGFSETVNDYKIVKCYSDRDFAVRGVEMYSLSTDSWKKLECRSIEGLWLLDNYVTVNGVMVWPAFGSVNVVSDGDHRKWIVSFDIATEVFKLIQTVPEPFRLPYFNVYEGQFAILYCSTIGDFPDCLSYSIDLWVLEEDIGSCTERWSWTKKYARSWPEKCTSGSLGYFANTIWRNEVVCGLTDDGLLDMENNEEKVGLYFINIITNECKMLAIPTYCRSGRVFNYVESLVSVGNIHLQEP